MPIPSNQQWEGPTPTDRIVAAIDRLTRAVLTVGTYPIMLADDRLKLYQKQLAALDKERADV